MAAAGGDVIGLDWRIPLDEGWALAGEDRARAGQPRPGGAARPLGAHRGGGARDVLARAGGRPGHIFNLGHGVLPGTDPDVLGRLRELVHAGRRERDEQSSHFRHTGVTKDTLRAALPLLPLPRVGGG